ncbi:unnamed protein product [Rhizophagus irregularis]|uniref:Uncharacterized protein n=1 Tax=Rhizophagus irregularis TaxID=588596 RepID=A0A915YNN3_9GLOM|nr:unnamed protein product [Rhizophagus irregularis]CAB5296692.1 unnamed protein product [Rhizophagus irregularis]
MNELWKPGREMKERPGFKRTNYGNLDVRRPGFKKKNELWKPGRETKLNDQDSKKERNMNELWKPGRETKLNDQDSKKRTNYGQGPDPNQIQIRFKSDSNGSKPDSDQIEPNLIGFGSDQIY